MIETTYNYTCPKCNINDKMILSLANKGEFKGQFFYTCSQEYCDLYLNTYLNTNHSFDNFIMQKWSCEFRGFNKKPLTCKDCINCAKINMLDILSEYVECGYGPHYMSVFGMIIKPHLDNLEILKFFLKSTNTIVDEFNNANGYKMYEELYQHLNEVKNLKIKEFLKFEFSSYINRY